jgi:hypothetical protein
MMETVQLVDTIPLPESGIPPGGAEGGHQHQRP